MAEKKTQNSELNGAKLKVSQTRSVIGRDQRVRSTLAALGLGKIGKSVVVAATPSMIGMVERIKSVVSVELAK